MFRTYSHHALSDLVVLSTLAIYSLAPLNMVKLEHQPLGGLIIINRV